MRNIFLCPLRIKEEVISSKRDLGLDFKFLVMRVMKYWDRWPREVFEFHPSQAIFKNALGRCLNVGIVVPVRKVEGQNRCSPEKQPIFYASTAVSIFMVWELSNQL